MAITSLNQILAGMQPLQFYNKVASPTLVAGRPHSFWSAAGTPGAGTFNNTLAGGVYSSSGALVAGQIPHGDPAPGASSYLARFQAAAIGTAGNLLLCDRIWDNGGITITSTAAQTIGSPVWPARDSTGTTSGVGVVLGVEVSAATGAGTPSLSISYTNSSGATSRTGVNQDATLASAVTGAFHRITLQAGDSGVQSVQSITLGATWTSGTINVVAYRILAQLELAQSLVPNALDAVTSGFPQLFNGVVPFLIFIPSTTLATSITAHYLESQG